MDLFGDFGGVTDFIILIISILISFISAKLFRMSVPGDNYSHRNQETIPEEGVLAKDLPKYFEQTRFNCFEYLIE
jgi:hypothetical protein